MNIGTNTPITPAQQQAKSAYTRTHPNTQNGQGSQAAQQAASQTPPPPRAQPVHERQPAAASQNTPNAPSGSAAGATLASRSPAPGNTPQNAPPPASNPAPTPAPAPQGSSLSGVPASGSGHSNPPSGGSSSSAAQNSPPPRTPQPNDAQSALALINGVPQHPQPQQHPPHTSERVGQNVNVTV